MRPMLLALMSGWALLATTVETPGSDLAYTKTVNLKVVPGKTGYTLDSTVQVGVTYLTPRSTRQRVYEESEHPFSQIQGLQAKVRSEPLSADHITFHYPLQKDVFIPTSRVHKVEFPADLHPKDTVSYEFSETWSDLAFMPLLEVPNLDRVEAYRVVVDHPADLKVDFSCFYPWEPLQPTLSHPQPTRTILAFGPLPHRRPKPFMPFNATQAVVLPVLSRSGTRISPTAPDRFAAWYLAMLPADPAEAERLRALPLPGLKEDATPRDKMRVLFERVRSGIRYIADEGGRHAIIPRSPSLVLERSYGDCKDKALLLTRWGQSLGLKVHMVLLSTEPVPPLADIHVHQFNHVISAFEDGDHLLFMDPTATRVAFGDLPEQDQARSALLLDAANPRVVRIPTPTDTPAIAIRIQGDLEHPKESRAEVVLRHDWRTIALRTLKEDKPLEAENRLSNGLNSYLGRLSLDHFKVVSEGEDQITFEATADLSEFLVVSERRTYLPSNPFRVLEPSLLERAGDTHAMDPGPLKRLSLSLELTHGGTSLKPQAFSLAAGGLATFDAKCWTEGAVSRASYAFNLMDRDVDGERRKAFLTFCEGYLAQRRQLFVLERNTP